MDRPQAEWAAPVRRSHGLWIGRERVGLIEMAARGKWACRWRERPWSAPISLAECVRRLEAWADHEGIEIVNPGFPTA